MRTRFAPSPTGRLHLGHVFSALTAWEIAQEAGGEFLLRIEDADAARCRPEFEAAIRDDLAWLGIAWPEPALRQSERLPRYAAMLERLTGMGLTYPCRCTRADIRAALSAPQEGAAAVVYPGTCRGRLLADVGASEAVRLNLDRALEQVTAEALGFEETGPAHRGWHRLDAGLLGGRIGDVVLGRKDIGTAAYHLAVVVDDAEQGVTDVVRGEDLWEATPLHRLLQALLGLPTPVYHHHRLIRDAEGRRLAKRDDARAIARYREDGLTAAHVRALVGL
ncbi:MAG: tRNA glutamyl-Q(34) synthetase GluQRS [Rhodobacteraceae bacterium]|nr:tRNA glutamyl-Q(34) synthetase GluQRS [Paracoccaceae bacterium]